MNKILRALLHMMHTFVEGCRARGYHTRAVDSTVWYPVQLRSTSTSTKYSYSTGTVPLDRTRAGTVEKCYSTVALLYPRAIKMTHPGNILTRGRSVHLYIVFYKRRKEDVKSIPRRRVKQTVVTKIINPMQSSMTGKPYMHSPKKRLKKNLKRNTKPHASWHLETANVSICDCF